MRKLLDENNEQLEQVLAEMLAGDLDITAREVARRHPTLRNASAFTRNEDRARIIEVAQKRQAEARAVAVGPHKQKAESLAEKLEARTAEVEQLRSQLKALVSSHVACVRAVMKHGGMPALERFWRDYRAIGEMVRALKAMPPGAEIVPLPGPKRHRNRS